MELSRKKATRIKNPSSSNEFMIPKGNSPLGIIVTTSINPGFPDLKQRARVTLDDVEVLNWEGAAPEPYVTQVAQTVVNRPVAKKCLVEIFNNVNGWRPSITRSTVLNSWAAGAPPGYVMHIVYSDTDVFATATSDFDDCVVHLGYLLDPPPVVPEGHPLNDTLTPMFESMKNGSETAQETAAISFLKLVEDQPGSSFAVPDIVVAAMNCAKKAVERTKSLIMYAIGKITMHNPDVVPHISESTQLVADLLCTSSNPNIQFTAVESLWMLSFQPLCVDQVKKQVVIERLLELESTTNDPAMKKNIYGLLFQLGLRPTPVRQKCTCCAPPPSTKREGIFKGAKAFVQALGVGSSSEPADVPARPNPPVVVLSIQTQSQTLVPGPKPPRSPSPSPVGNGATTQAQAPQPPHVPINPPDPTNKGMIMISYNWGHQTMVKKIKARLTENGYNVWIDVERMRGSTLEAMALAVEDSTVILVCVSKAYKESAACRTEGEYAYQLKRHIVPLKMEKEYRADGWLGALLGTKLYHSFISQEEEVFNSKMNSLMIELGDRGKF